MRMLAVIIFSVQLFSQTRATLTATPSVACSSDNSVIFTCTLAGAEMQWIVSPRPQVGVWSEAGSVLSTITSINIGRSGFRFRADFVGVSGGMVTSTLTTITAVSALAGAMVRCEVVARGVAGPIPITLAVAPSPPLSVSVLCTQNQPSYYKVTLSWSPPSSTGGVSVNYVLTISPPPLSGSPVTVGTSSTQIRVSYNTPYNVFIRAVNCAGMSSNSQVATIPSIVACSSNPSPANRVSLSDTPPPPALMDSTLRFTCNGQTVSATCESDGRWSPNPSTYECVSAICTVPDEPSSGSIVYVVDGAIMNYASLDETVEETTVLTYQCDTGLSLTGPNTITCTNTGVWSTDPREIICVASTTTATDAAPTVAPLSTGATVASSTTTVSTTTTNVSLSTGAPLFTGFTGTTIAISVVVNTTLTLVIGFLAGLLVMYLCMRKKAVYSPTAEGQANVGPAAPAGPVYDEVGLKEEKVNTMTNKAYESVGL